MAACDSCHHSKHKCVSTGLACQRCERLRICCTHKRDRIRSELDGRRTDTMQRARSQTSSDHTETEWSVQDPESIDTSAAVTQPAPHKRGTSTKPIDSSEVPWNDTTGSGLPGTPPMECFVKAGIQLQRTAMFDMFNDGALNNLFQSAIEKAIAPLLLRVEEIKADIQRIEGKVDGTTQLHGDQIYILNQHRVDLSAWGTQLLQQLATMCPFTLSNTAALASYPM